MYCPVLGAAFSFHFSPLRTWHGVYTTYKKKGHRFVLLVTIFIELLPEGTVKYNGSLSQFLVNGVFRISSAYWRFYSKLISLTNAKHWQDKCNLRYLCHFKFVGYPTWRAVKGMRRASSEERQCNQTLTRGWFSSQVTVHQLVGAPSSATTTSSLQPTVSGEQTAVLLQPILIWNMQQTSW